MMLCLCGLAFVSCESSDDPFDGGNKFKACAFVATPTFSQDLLNLFDFTMTYTAMDGSVKTVKPNTKGELYAEDVYQNLPATVKFEVKAVKKANFDEYLKSKDVFDFSVVVPGYVASYLSSSGELVLLHADVNEFDMKGIKSEVAADYLSKRDNFFNYTFEGTYTKNSNGTCSFSVK